MTILRFGVEDGAAAWGAVCAWAVKGAKTVRAVPSIKVDSKRAVFMAQLQAMSHCPSSAL